MIVESYYIDWQEMNNTDAGSGPNWLFQYDSTFEPFNTTSESTGPSEPTDNFYKGDDVDYRVEYVPCTIRPLQFSQP